MQAEAGSQGSDLKVQRRSKDHIWSKGLPVERRPKNVDPAVIWERGFTEFLLKFMALK